MLLLLSIVYLLTKRTEVGTRTWEGNVHNPIHRSNSRGGSGLIPGITIISGTNGFIMEKMSFTGYCVFWVPDTSWQGWWSCADKDSDCFLFGLSASELVLFLYISCLKAELCLTHLWVPYRILVGTNTFVKSTIWYKNI